MTETRRHALKLLGTIGATCTFPFAGDELYGQHVHPVLLQRPEASGPYQPTFFTAAEYAVLSHLADVIIPATDTAGAAEAGVPEYIDRVVTLNTQHQPVMRAGLAWLEKESQRRFSLDFGSIAEARHVDILQPLSDEVDRQQRAAERTRFRTDAKGATVYFFALTDKDAPAASPSAVRASAGVTADDLPVRFFRLVKHLTVDGYYTSRIGLLDELGYKGNGALGRFPGCEVREQ